MVKALANKYNLEFSERDSHILEQFGATKHMVFLNSKGGFSLDYIVRPEGITIGTVWCMTAETNKSRRVSEEIKSRMDAIFPERVKCESIVQ